MEVIAIESKKVSGVWADVANSIGSIVYKGYGICRTVFLLMTEYDGFGAEIVKGFVVLLMGAAILYPWWSFALIWLPLSRRVSPIGQGLIYGLCVAQFFAVVIGAAYFDYRRKSRIVV